MAVNEAAAILGNPEDLSVERLREDRRVDGETALWPWATPNQKPAIAKGVVPTSRHLKNNNLTFVYTPAHQKASAKWRRL